MNQNINFIKFSDLCQSYKPHGNKLGKEIFIKMKDYVEKHRLQTCFEISFTDICEDVKLSLVNKFGMDEWNKMSDETQKYLLTGLYCFIQLTFAREIQYKNLDFSSSYSLIIKIKNECLSTDS